MSTGLLFEINDVDATDWLFPDSLEINKETNNEYCSFTLTSRELSASTTRPQIGDKIYITQNDNLIFGGEIDVVTENTGDRPTSGGLSWFCESNGYTKAADLVLLDSIVIPEGTLVTDAGEMIRAASFGPAWSIPQGGVEGVGPAVPEIITIDKRPAREALDKLTELTGWLWRINGGPVFFMHAPGGVPGPAFTYANANIVNVLEWRRSRVHRYTRIWVKWGTGSPPAYVSATTGVSGRLIERLYEHPELESEAAAQQQADAYLARAQGSPLEVTLETDEINLYPGVSATITIPERQLSGDYMVRSVRIREIGTDPDVPRCLLTEATLVEGGEYVPTWLDFWRTAPPPPIVGPPPPEDTCVTFYSQNFAAGNGDSHQVASYERSVDGADSVYPECTSGHYVQVVSGQGPAGENVLDWWDDPGGGTDDYGVAGWTVELDAFDANGPMRCSVQMRPNATSLAATSNAPILSLRYAWDTSSEQFTLYAVDNGGGTWSLDLYYRQWGTSAGYVNSHTFSAASVQDAWQTYTLRWKCGTPTVGGGFLTDVAADGYIQVYHGETLIYDIQNIKFWLWDVEPVNTIKAVWLGYYGLWGQATNMRLCAE